MANPTSYVNAWLALLPQAFLPTQAAGNVARECARFADWKTGANVRPGRALLAENLNCSETTVKTGLGDLVAHGLLRLETKGGLAGTRAWASVYQLTVPAHLATEDNLARFPDPTAVQVVQARVKGRAKPRAKPKTEADRSEETPVGGIPPTENPTDCAPSGSHTARSVGGIPPGQWVVYRPPPSIDPPVTLQEPQRAAARPMTTTQDDAKDDDARTAEEVAADGLHLVRQELENARRRRLEGDRP